MTVVEYLHMLIKDGIWLAICPDHQRVYLALLARSRGNKQTIDWRGFHEFTGLNEDEVYSALDALVTHGLLEKAKDQFKLAIDPLDHESIAIPKPPYEKTGIEFQEALRNLLAGQWEGILGGSLVVYVLQLWFDYIYRLDSNKTHLSEQLPYDSAILEGFQELEFIAYKDNSKPIYLMTPADWSEVINTHPLPQKQNTLSASQVDYLFASLED